ncbi:MAG: GEVED domain-containing protein, partial [Holophagales bacterium]|nr:GEVED domain-containing protein [Holophagales bacterium]
DGALSADGSSVVFSTNSTDLVAGFMGPAGRNLYHWDTGTGGMLLVSHAFGGLTTGSDGSLSTFSISEDGDGVAFESTASNLIATDANGTRDIYLWQRGGSTVQLISRSFVSPAAANFESSAPSISRDGSTLAFESRATDLVGPPWASISRQVYFWRSATGVQLASRSTAGPTTPGSAESFVEGVTADGGAVLFNSASSDLVDDVSSGLFAFDLSSEEMTLLNPFCRPTLPRLNSTVGEAIEPSISDDGRFVAFYGSAHPLIDDYELRGATTQVHLWDRATGEVKLVSHSFEGPQIAADSAASLAKVSGDGSLVIFGSRATNLVPGYVNPASGDRYQVYAWDRLSGGVTLVTPSTASPAQGANGDTFRYEVSADGNYVVLATEATDLVAGVTDANGGDDLYLWERATGTLRLITEGPPGSTANTSSGRFSLSADAELVTFSSSASDLVAGTDLNGRNDVFLWQRSTGVTTLVSHVFGDPTTTTAGHSSSEAKISADGSTVVFTSFAPDLVSTPINTLGNSSVFRWSRLTDTMDWITPSVVNAGAAGERDSSRPMVSSDGSAILFISPATDLQNTFIDANGGNDIFYWDEASGQVRLLTRSASIPGFAANTLSERHRLSADGSRAVFVSRADDLVAGSTSFGDDVFLWDRATDEIRRISHIPGDPLTGGEGQSTVPVMSADGLSVAFHSSAEDLMSGAFAGDKRQVFVSTPVDPVDLELAITPSLDPAPVGEVYSTTIDVTNLSSDDAVHAMLSVSLPPGQSLVDATGTAWSCRAASIKLSCRRRGALPAGQTVEPLVLRLVAPPVGGTSEIRAALTWPGIDLELANNIVTATTTFAPDDWGDAPDPGYPTLAASNGASHGFGDLFLGTGLDVDVDGQPTADADGDTLDGTNDEDGVSFLVPIVVGQSGNVEVIASAGGVLDAWIDWNANGSWNDLGEHVFAGQAVSAGSNTLSLAAPIAALTGRTFARFRLSSAGISTPTGRADDGEVEDYAVQVESIGFLTTVSGDPTLVPEVGGDVSFDVEVLNTGTGIASVTTLFDDLAGDLNGRGTCAIPQLIVAGGSYSCSYTLELSGPVDETETHVITAAGASFGFAVADSGEATVTFFDSIEPELEGFATLPDVGDGPLLECGTVRRAPSQIDIIFSEQLAEGAGGADDEASYRLLRTGPDLAFETVDCSAVEPTDEAVAFSATHVPGDDRFDPSTTSLAPSEPLADGLYRLFVCDGLLDLGDNSLPGGDVRLDFRVDDGNLFRNGHFDCTIDDWQQDPPSAEIAHDPTDADDSVQSGSLRVASLADSSFGLDQCLAVGAETSLVFDTRLRLDTAPDLPVGLARGCSFFGAEACQDPIDQAFSIDLLLDTGGLFSRRTQRLVTPPGTVSMDCGFVIEATSGGFDLFLDRTILKVDDSIFSDGFESGDTLTWSSTSP